ncbi:hypothetical protein QUA82_33100 [Microcoleus sp. F8-D3]
MHNSLPALVAARRSVASVDISLQPVLRHFHYTGDYGPTVKFLQQQAIDHRFTVWVNRLPLRILNELTTTITTFVVLFSPAGRAVLHDVIRTTAWAE